MSGLVNDGMDKGSMMDSEDRIEKAVDIYISAEAVRDMKHKKNTEDFNTETMKTKTPQHTGSDCVRNRSSRAAAVCLGLLCVLLLTAVIVLCVHIHTLSTNYTEERDQIRINITNLKEERDELIINKKNLTNEREELLNKITNITEERDELIMNKKNLTNERDQLKFKNKNLTNERDQLLNKITNITEERDGLIMNKKNLTNERDQLIFKNKNLTNELQIRDGWTYYQSSFYYISNEMKNWTESRRYCTARGADLIIINNQKEQDFVNNISNGTSVWIGLTDRDVEGRWKWVDGTNMTYSFWWSGEPNGGSKENCVLAVVHDRNWPNILGWIDHLCNIAFQWICEKNISQLILP